MLAIEKHLKAMHILYFNVQAIVYIIFLFMSLFNIFSKYLYFVGKTRGNPDDDLIKKKKKKKKNSLMYTENPNKPLCL